MFEVKVGYLVPIVVVKALPDYASMLTMIAGTEVMALLPKKYSNRTYRVGDTTVASIYSIDRDRIILHQRTSQYFRKLLELLLSPLIQAGKLLVKKAAVPPTPSNLNNFAKVSIAGLNGGDPIGLAIPYLRDLKRYTDDTVTLIEYSDDLRKYVVNALRPAPKERVKGVIHFQTLKEVLVKVEHPFIGKFLGKNGLNAIVASRLVGIGIKIESDRPEEGSVY